MNKEYLRNTLAVMERGKGIAYFKRNIWVTFNNEGEFNIFHNTQHVRHSTTTSLSEAVRNLTTTLNNY